MPHNVAHFLAEQARLHPGHAAVRAPSGRNPAGVIRYLERSFAELETEAAALAHHFQKRGIQRGTRVLLMVRPGLDLIRTVFIGAKQLLPSTLTTLGVILGILGLFFPLIFPLFNPAT